MRRDDVPRRDRVAIDLTDISADRAEKSVDLAQGMVEATSARPSIAPVEDRLVPVLRADAIDLITQHFDDDIPIRLNECLMVSPLRVRSRTVSVPALADRWAHDTTLSNCLQRLSDRRWARIFGKRVHRSDVVTVRLDIVRTPIRQWQMPLGRQDSLNLLRFAQSWNRSPCAMSVAAPTNALSSTHSCVFSVKPPLAPIPVAWTAVAKRWCRHTQLLPD